MVVAVMGLRKAIGLGFLPLGLKDETSGYTPPDSEPVGVGRNYPGGMRMGTAVALVRFAAKHGRIPLPSDLRVLLVTGEQDEVVDVARAHALILSLQHQGTIQAECWSLEGHGQSGMLREKFQDSSSLHRRHAASREHLSVENCVTLTVIKMYLQAGCYRQLQ